MVKPRLCPFLRKKVEKLQVPPVYLRFSVQAPSKRLVEFAWLIGRTERARVHNPVETLAAALHSACLRDLPKIIWQERDLHSYQDITSHLSPEQRIALTMEELTARELVASYERTRRHTDVDVSIALFEQVWPSVGLGYEGVHEQLFTPAYSVVVTSRQQNISAVYFGNGGKLAYLVPASARTLLNSLINARRLPGVKEAAQMGWLDILHDHPAPLMQAQPSYRA